MRRWWCSNPARQNRPPAYIVADFDRLSLTGEGCLAPTFTTEQAIEVGRKHVKEHPNAWHQPSPVLLRVAFRQVFPC